MGVIKRQGIKQSIVVYAGTLIGIVNVLFIYPYFLRPEELGLARFLIDTAGLIAPFVLFGATGLTVRFFPEFKDDKSNHRGFFGLLLLYALAGIGVATAVYLIFREPIMAYYAERDELFRQYFYALWWCSIFYALSLLVKQYATNFRRIVVPSLIQNYLFKIALPLLAFLYYFEIISLGQLVYGLIFSFALNTLLQVGYLIYLGEFRFGRFLPHLNKSRAVKMFSFAMFGLFGSVGNKIVNFLDSFMIGSFHNLEGLGVFYIAFVITNVMSVPFLAINSISAPVIAEAWHKNNKSEIESLYSRSCIVLLTAGLGIFLLIWTNIDHFYELMPNGDLYIAGKSVILILGISKLLDLATGLNAAVIGYSNYYRYNFYFMGILAVGNIFLNLWLIPLFGIDGAALATLISLGAFNLARYSFIWLKFGMQPFDWGALKMLLTGILLIFVGSWLPSAGILFLDIAWQTILMGTLYSAVIWYSNWCPDLKSTMEVGLNRGLEFFNLK